jgi:hypothetical protein
VQANFSNKTYGSSSTGLGDAFRTTLCAGLKTSTVLDAKGKGFDTRRIDSDDHGLIATWFLQGGVEAFSSAEQEWGLSSASWHTVYETLFNDVGDPASFMPPTAVSPSIDATIRSATIRRTFFITKKGYFGLGPAKTRRGDQLCILMGGQTPFVLRQSESRKMRVAGSEGDYDRKFFEMIGDCYTHGLMDGEAMEEWGKEAGSSEQNLLIQKLSKNHLEAVQKRARLKNELFGWRRETNKELMVNLTGHAQKAGISDEMLGIALLGVNLNEWAGDAETKEPANSFTSNLSEWRGGLGPLAQLVKAARLKTRRIEKDVLEAERDVHILESQINEVEAEMGKIIYLV